MNSSNELQNRPDNYLAISILSTIFCCLSLGIQANKINNKFVDGNHEGAK